MSIREEISREPVEALPAQLAQERERLASLEAELGQRPNDEILKRRIRRTKSAIQELTDQIERRGNDPQPPRAA